MALEGLQDVELGKHERFLAAAPATRIPHYLEATLAWRQTSLVALGQLSAEVLLAVAKNSWKSDLLLYCVSIVNVVKLTIQLLCELTRLRNFNLVS